MALCRWGATAQGSMMPESTSASVMPSPCNPVPSSRAHSVKPCAHPPCTQQLGTARTHALTPFLAPGHAAGVYLLVRQLGWACLSCITLMCVAWRWDVPISARGSVGCAFLHFQPVRCALVWQCPPPPLRLRIFALPAGQVCAGVVLPPPPLGCAFSHFQPVRCALI